MEYAIRISSGTAKYSSRSSGLPAPGRLSNAPCSMASLIRSSARRLNGIVLTVHDLPADHRQHRLDRMDLVDRHGHVVLREDGEVGELSDFEGAALLLVE